jgi:hypothetical protein
MYEAPNQKKETNCKVKALIEPLLSWRLCLNKEASGEWRSEESVNQEQNPRDRGHPVPHYWIM